MPLQIIKNNIVKETGMPDTTQLGKSNGFVIQLYQNDYYNHNSEFWRLNDLKTICGVSTENLSISFNTEWTETGGAKLGKKITGYVNGSLFKALAGQSDEGFQPMILSDEWTQKKLKGTTPIKIDLTFKLYKDKSIAGSCYKDAILFLTHICAPPKKVKMGTDSVDLIKRVGTGVYNVAEKVVGSTRAAMNADQESIGTVVGTVVNTANDIYKGVTSNAVLGRNNGNFTVLFSFGEKVYSHNNFNVDYTNNKITGNIDWIVSNFSFTPSTQFYWDEDKKIPLPMWCDFKVSLETRLTLSNKYVYDLLHENILQLNTESI